VSNQTEWRWADPAGQQRLVREDELRAALRSGAIPANAPVWTRGWKAWRPANEVAELTGKIEAPANGADVPPPPNFIVAAQDAFEGKPAPAPTGPAEPPAPPRYVPIAPTTQPQIPKAPNSDTRVDAKVAPLPSPKPPTSLPPTVQARPPTKAPPPLPPAARNAAKKSSAPPPLPPAAKRSQPTMKATPAPPKVATSAATNLAKTAPSPGTTTKPMHPAQPSAFTHTQRPPAGVAPPAGALSSPPSGRTTLQVAPAPPPMPKLDPMPSAPQPPPKEASSKFPTLLMFDEAPSALPPPPTTPDEETEEAPPIVVPPPEPSNMTNAVTRPPPWGEGAVEMDTRIPKSPAVPAVGSETRPSDAPPRPVELSSSDLTSEARIEVVKAAPLAPAERPHATMQGLGPGALGENRALLEKAIHASPPPAPLSASDVASTTKWQAQSEDVPEPAPIPPSPSGAKLHDLRAIAAQRAQGAAERARHAWDDLRERTKDKPRWFLPVIAGTSACVLVILFAAGVKELMGSGSTASSAATTATTTAPATATAATTAAATVATTAPVAPARPMECTTAGSPRTVAPKALVGSGVEVTDVGGKVALGFAAAPKEATLEIVDPQTTASLGSLHLPENAKVRRVVALDDKKMAVDLDRKGDPLQGRRTLRAATPIDLGATEDGLAWAPLASDKSVKLWPLPSADQPVESLRGEPLPNAAGFAIAFRHAGAIWFGAFGGTPPAPLGSLLHVDGLGPKIGSPAVAASGDRMMVAWADRATKDDPWSVRYAFFRPSDATAQSKTFSLGGGAPERAMSPSLAPLGGGRFLFVWTGCPEGVACQVRGVVFNADGTTTAPFTASSEDVNAGQGQAAVLADGRGVVAFLAATGKHSFEVHATPIHCAEK
jgi:hypothetical protein